METKQIAALATDIATARAFDYAGNFGRGTFRFEVKASCTDTSVTLRAVTNARITEKQAQAELTAVWDALIVAMGDSAKLYKVKKTVDGKRVGRGGFWHMSRFCTDSFWRGMELKEVTG
jgi:hypothetical protein